MKRKIYLLLLALLAIPYTSVAQNADRKGYVIVTDFVKADGKKDVSDAIQRIIDQNPNHFSVS